MSKQYAHLHAMAKTSVKFQNDWPKTVGGVALTSQLLTNRWVTALLYRTCVSTQVRQKIDFQDGGHLGFLIRKILAIYDLLVIQMLPTKFQANWSFGSGKEVKNRFSRWRPS